jgi:phosphatidylglycerophosphate synthase
MRSGAIDEDICIYVQRPLVVAFVRRLTQSAVTPNQITLLRALLGVIGGALLATGRPSFLIASALCLILSGILDAVDGQLAAAKGCASLSGRIFDGVADAVVFTAMQIGLYYHVRAQLSEIAWVGEGGFVLLVVVASVLQLVGFNYWDYHKNRTRQLTGDPRGVVHRPETVRDLLWQGGNGAQRMMLLCYLAYCRFQSFLARDRRPIRAWPSTAPEAAIAGRTLRSLVRGWSYLGQATNETILAFAVLGAVLNPLFTWYFLLGLLVVLPPYIVVMRIWSAAVEGRLRAAGVI